jgi:putative membrane protein
MRSTLANAIRGALIGAAEVVPGISGGTIALIVGVYRALIAAIADAVLAVRQLVGIANGRPSASKFAATLRSLPWSLLIPLGIGMVAAVIIGARVLEPILDEYPVTSRAFFFGLIVAAIYVPAHLVTRLNGGRWGVRDVVIALIAAVVVFLITGLPPTTIDDPSPLVILGSAAIAICALVLPGVSGSFLLLSFGMYEPTIQAVNDRNLTYLAIFALGAVLGLAVFVSILRWLLEHRAHITLVILTGFMVGSLRALWPWQTEERGLQGPGDDVLGVVLLAAAGAAIVVVLLLVERRFGLTEEQEDAGLLKG